MSPGVFPPGPPSPARVFLPHCCRPQKPALFSRDPGFWPAHGPQIPAVLSEPRGRLFGPKMGPPRGRFKNWPPGGAPARKPQIWAPKTRRYPNPSVSGEKFGPYAPLGPPPKPPKGPGNFAVPFSLNPEWRPPFRYSSLGSPLEPFLPGRRKPILPLGQLACAYDDRAHPRGLPRPWAGSGKTILAAAAAVAATRRWPLPGRDLPDTEGRAGLRRLRPARTCTWLGIEPAP